MLEKRYLYFHDRISKTVTLFLKDGRLIKSRDPKRSDQTFFYRDPTFSDFDPKRIAIRGRIENRIETISNPTNTQENMSFINATVEKFKFFFHYSK
jgi:hypothetical protein